MPTLCRRFALWAGVFCALMPLTSGCTPPAPVTSTLIPRGERFQLADGFVKEAVGAYNTGDVSKGDAAAQRAVILFTSTLTGDFSDEGYIEVAKRLAAKGRPQDAVRLLDPLTTDKRVADDPLLWATLADVARQAANAPRAEQAQLNASAAARKIVAAFGSTPPGGAAAVKQAERASRAGQYFDEHTKEYAKALRAYREAHRLLPNDPFTRNNLGYLLAERGTTAAEFEEAVRLTRAVVEKYPDEPIFLDSFGWALFQRNDAAQKDREGAEWRLRQAVDAAPELAECRYHLAVVYDALDKHDDAQREAERAVILKPDYGEAIALWDRLRGKGKP